MQQLKRSQSLDGSESHWELAWRYLCFFLQRSDQLLQVRSFYFIFIYQLSGSFITSAGEYVIWILAFTTVFKEFDIESQEKILIPVLIRLDMIRRNIFLRK